MTMDRRPFQPADGETARWRKLYELVVSKREDDQITYREAEDLLDCDRQAAYGAMLVAKKHLEEDGQQSVENKRYYGWIVMPPRTHITEAQHHLTKAHTQARIAVRKITAIDDRRADLSQFERQDADRILYRAHAAVALSGKSKRSLAELLAESQRTSRLSLVPPQTA